MSLFYNERRNTVNFKFSPARGYLFLPFLFVVLLRVPLLSQSPLLSGSLQQWHKVTLTFDGPECSETSVLGGDEGVDNPFTDFRMLVDFYQGDRHYLVPGYYAADGNSGETGASEGSKWRVHFRPDKVGDWQWRAYFRKGDWIAISDIMDEGEGISFNGSSGEFTVSESDKKAPDFRAKGRLDYVGKHYLQFAGSKEYFLKGGADAPEVFLAYQEIDGTYAHDGNEKFMKHWEPHVKDWQEGDPTWMGRKGKGIIGALNYLSSKGMNAVSFLTMNVEGDGKNVWPWVSDHDFYHFDCSKLDQWETIFSHAQSKGLFLHFKTQETENDQLLDGGALGKERKLYYRELIARFGHHLALNWNLGEENTQTEEQRKAMAKYFHDHDPYRHLVVIHTYPDWQDDVYEPLLGQNSYLTGASVQTHFDLVHNRTLQWVHASAQAGKPWVVANDEQGGANRGVTPEASYPGMNGRSDNHLEILRYTLWGNLMAGGAGVEYYFGYKYPESDLTCNDWRSRDQMWDYTRYALEFFQQHLRFWEMKNGDHLVGNEDAYCLIQEGLTYVVFLPKAIKNNTIDLSQVEGSEFTVKWFDPRKGGDLQTGSLASVLAGKALDVGLPPHSSDREWVFILNKK